MPWRGGGDVKRPAHNLPHPTSLQKMKKMHASISRRTVVGFAASAVAGLLLPGCGGSNDDGALGTDAQARFQEVLDRNRALFSFPGTQAGIWTADGSWIGVSGASTPGGKTPPSRDDHTRIGSITKTFTVMLLLQLVEQKLLSLEDPIGKYVPGLPNGDTATLRMLANMTSGIPPYTDDARLQAAFFSNPQVVFTPVQLVNFVKGKKHDFDAGTQVAYSNTNTVALGMVIEQVTGKPFAQVLQKGILIPLGLTHTSFPASSTAMPSPHLQGITIQGDPADTIKNATNWNPSWTFTAGEMISTLDDLRHWAVALGTGGGLVSPEMQKQREASMFSTVPPNAPARAYALGFGVFNGWIGHTGELPGFNTSIMYHPKSQAVVVVMVNSDVAAPGANGKPLNPAPTISDELINALAL
jgi:D-alanyl-D-alanine carboxypeptidase